MDICQVSLVALTTTVLVGGSLARAQTPNTATPQGRSMGMMQVDESQASAMMAECQQMMNAMHAMDQKLKDLVGKMDTASGSAKTDAIAAVIKNSWPSGPTWLAA